MTTPQRTTGTFLRRETDGRIHVSRWENGSRVLDLTAPLHVAAVGTQNAAAKWANEALREAGYDRPARWSQPDGWDQVNFDLRATPDIAARFEEPRTLAPDTVVWTAGHNLPGYLPEADVAVFATADEAREYIAGEIERYADELEMGSLGHPDVLLDAAYADAENVKHNADGDFSDEFTIHVDTGTHSPTAYWVQKSTVADVFQGDTSSEEYQALLDSIPEQEPILVNNSGIPATEAQAVAHRQAPEMSVYVTASSAQWVNDEHGNPSNDPIEAHGWVDPTWSPTELHAKREDVRPLWTGTDPADAAAVIESHLGRIEPIEPGRGNYYGTDGSAVITDRGLLQYSHAAHLVDATPQQIHQVDSALDAYRTPVVNSHPLHELRRAPQQAARPSAAHL